MPKLPRTLALLDASLADIVGKVASPPPFLSTIPLYPSWTWGLPTSGRQGPGGLPNFFPPRSHLWGIELLPLKGEAVGI